jgi:regulator of extracellular matrix RemA (YlzA/DUF370 family)
VHPGGIKTNIVRNSDAVDGQDLGALIDLFDKKLAKTSAEAAAKAILRAVSGNRPRAVVGLDAKLLDLVVRVLGPGYQRLVTIGFSRVASGSRRAPESAPASAPAKRVNGKAAASA